MTQQQLIQHAQHAAMPREDVSQYEGKWIAIRNGHIVAADRDPVRLRANPDVHVDDALMPVPRDGHSLLIA